jgi:hypothetical protein
MSLSFCGTLTKWLNLSSNIKFTTQYFSLSDLKSKCDLYDKTSAQEDSDSEHQPKQDQK